MPSDYPKLNNFLIKQMAKGETLSDAFLQARPLIIGMSNQRLGFADQKTRVIWGKATVAMLRELQARDSMLCYLAVSSQPLDAQTLQHGFSDENTKTFQQTVIKVFESARRGVVNGHSTDYEHVEFNAAALEYRSIQNVIVQQFGEPISVQLENSHIRQKRNDLAEKMCAARIFQLDAMLERPQAMAAMLIDSVLR